MGTYEIVIVGAASELAEPKAPMGIPDMEPGLGAGGDGKHIVIVYDNDHNTQDQVIGILQRATGCSRDEAEMETWEVHHLGKSVVHQASREECEGAAAIIRTIGIRVEVVES